MSGLSQTRFNQSYIQALDNPCPISSCDQLQVCLEGCDTGIHLDVLSVARLKILALLIK